MNRFLAAMNKQLTTDEVLVKIGSYGRFQIMLTVFINIAYGLWWGFPLYVMMFIASEPGWKCKTHVNSTCPFNKTIHLGDDEYSFRCNIPREDWTFEHDRTSVVTQVQHTTIMSIEFTHRENNKMKILKTKLPSFTRQ